MAEYKVVELFTSINGEGTRAGQLAVFVRFQGCNLNCSFCDTQWANQRDTKYQSMTEEAIANYILGTNVRNVTLTGGEPLLQEDILILLKRLSREINLSIEIETNGSIPIGMIDELEYRPHITMDYKLPSSGMESKMCLENLSHLQKEDTVKFVCGTQEDLNRVLQIIEEYQLIGRCAIYLSPVFGQIEPAHIVEFMKEKHLNEVNLQLQLHKFIWNPDERGV